MKRRPRSIKEAQKRGTIRQGNNRSSQSHIRKWDGSTLPPVRGFHPDWPSDPRKGL